MYGYYQKCCHELFFYTLSKLGWNGHKSALWSKLSDFKTLFSHVSKQALASTSIINCYAGALKEQQLDLKSQIFTNHKSSWYVLYTEKASVCHARCSFAFQHSLVQWGHAPSSPFQSWFLFPTANLASRFTRLHHKISLPFWNAVAHANVTCLPVWIWKDCQGSWGTQNLRKFVFALLPR